MRLLSSPADPVRRPRVDTQTVITGGNNARTAAPIARGARARHPMNDYPRCGIDSRYPRRIRCAPSHERSFSRLLDTGNEPALSCIHLHRAVRTQGSCTSLFDLSNVRWVCAVLSVSASLSCRSSYLPSAALAQAVITGSVKDTSGAVLPGVSVEATSPVLIEKVRSSVTDGAGQYRIEDLRPGTYTVTFTLPGFTTFRREGIELTGSFIATINADLKVGTLRRNSGRHRGEPDRRRAECASDRRR